MNEQCNVVTDGQRCQGKLIPNTETLRGATSKCDTCGHEEVPEWVQHIERRSAAERIKNGG